MPSTFCRSLWGVLALLSACNVDYPNNRLQCMSDEMCPSGMHCGQNNRCSTAPSSSVHDDSLQTSGAGAKAAPSGASGTGGTQMLIEAHATAGSGSKLDAGPGPGAAGASASSQPPSRASCERDHGGCDQQVSCMLRDDKVVCGECPSGYRDVRGDGTQCLEIDECSSNTVNCGWQAICKNTPGKSSCELCASDMRASGTMCVPFASAQLGTNAEDFAFAIARGPDDTLYVTGTTTGALHGKNAGMTDVFVAKYDRSLQQQWVQQVGSSGEDDAYDIAVDAKGNATVVGYTAGSLDQRGNLGAGDGFVINFDANGNQRWIDVFGTAGDDSADAVVIDTSGAIFVFGYMAGSLDGTTRSGSDLVLLKYDDTGMRQVLNQWGSPQDDVADSMSLRGGKLFVSGKTKGSIDGRTTARNVDVFVSQLDLAGTVLWTRQIGSDGDDGNSSVAADSLGNVYMSAITNGNVENLVSQGGEDMLLVKYDGSGSEQWSRLLTSSADEEPNHVEVAPNDGVYILGLARGTLGAKSFGATDGVIAHYDSSGSQLWIRQFGSSANDIFSDVSIDTDSAALWVLGNTEGAVERQKNAGGIDVFVIRYNSDGNRL